jgi:peroxin-13
MGSYGGMSSYGGGMGSYGGMSSYGSPSYGGMSSYGGYGSSLASSRYGASYGGMGSYGGAGRYGGMSSYGGYGGMSSYGGMGGYGSTQSRYGSGYEDHNFRNPYPRGKYWSYGAQEGEGGMDNPIENAVESGGSLLMDMEHVVEGFGYFTRILDYNFETLHCSFASVLRLFDSMGELRRAVFYGLQGLAVFSVLAKCFRALQRFVFGLLGRPIPPVLTTEAPQGSLEVSFDDQWTGNGLSQSNVPKSKSFFS